MAETENPDSIDRQLRSVALPPGLLPRLREIAALGDAELDHLLRDVRPPAGLLDRLREIGSLSDADLDAEVRDVPLPADFRSRLVRTVRRQVARTQWISVAVAASLLVVVVGAAYYLHGPHEVAQGPQNANEIVPHSNVADANSGQQSATVAKDGGQQVTPPAIQLPAPNHLPGPRPAPNPADRLANEASNPNRTAVDPGHGNTLSPDSVPQGDKTPFTGQVSPLPQLSVVTPPLSRGVAGPRVAGYDVPFELLHHAHPFVIPGANAALRESRVPIWTGTQSYQLACRLAESGKLPAATEVHTEDFLAAMDYGFPLPVDEALGVQTAAGPAPWSPTGMSLLQIGVQAGRLPRDPQSATHLVLVIDGSVAMRSEGRWEQMRRGVAELIGQLTPDDRLSVVLMGRRAEALIRRADKAAAERFLASWPAADLGGAVNVTAALELAAELARQPARKDQNSSQKSSAPAAENHAAENELASRIVLLADGMTTADSQSVARLGETLHDVAADGVDWEMIDVRQDELLDDQWGTLAAAGAGSVRYAVTGDEIFQQLLETLAGQSQIVADGVSLKVTFNPGAVARYRLIGHEATGLGGLTGAPLKSEMLSGQAATALYEVELKPDTPEQVAMVEVTWREPITERPRTIRQLVSRQQFAPLWRETPLSLQLGALAAETGEVLRGSYFAPAGSHSLEQVAAFVDQANPALAARPAFVQLKRLIELARAARQPGAAARSGGS